MEFNDDTPNNDLKSENNKDINCSNRSEAITQAPFSKQKTIPKPKTKRIFSAKHKM